MSKIQPNFLFKISAINGFYLSIIINTYCWGRALQWLPKVSITEAG